jgi:hypothetical protein
VILLHDCSRDSVMVGVANKLSGHAIAHFGGHQERHGGDCERAACGLHIRRKLRAALSSLIGSQP